MSFLVGSNGTSFDQKLINSNQTTDVSTGNVFDGLDVTAHHENSSLNGFFVQIFFLSWDEIGAHDTDLLSSGNFARENTAKSIETACKKEVENF